MSKKIPLIVTHEPNAAGTAMTSPAIIHRERSQQGVKYYKGVYYDENHNPVMGDEVEDYKVKIDRATCELAGAYPYLFNVISYMCTHAKEVVIDLDPNGFYYSVSMTWEKFLDTALGDFIEQKHYLQKELMKLKEGAQAKIIPFNEHGSVYGQPVIVALFAGDGESLKPQAKTGLKNIGKKPVGTIQILFLKSLFRDSLNDTRYFNEPKAFYALLHHMAREIKTSKKIIANTDAEIEAEAPEEISLDTYVSAYNRVWNYIMLHDTHKEKDAITLDVIDMLSHTAPQYVQEKRNKVSIKKQTEAIEFLSDALTVFMNTEKYGNLNFTPLQWEFDKTKKRIVIKVKRLYIPTKKPDIPPLPALLSTKQKPKRKPNKF